MLLLSPHLLGLKVVPCRDGVLEDSYRATHGAEETTKAAPAVAVVVVEEEVVVQVVDNEAAGSRTYPQFCAL